MTTDSSNDFNYGDMLKTITRNNAALLGQAPSTSSNMGSAFDNAPGAYTADSGVLGMFGRSLHNPYASIDQASRYPVTQVPTISYTQPDFANLATPAAAAMASAAREQAIADQARTSAGIRPYVAPDITNLINSLGNNLSPSGIAATPTATPAPVQQPVQQPTQQPVQPSSQAQAPVVQQASPVVSIPTSTPTPVVQPPVPTPAQTPVAQPAQQSAYQLAKAQADEARAKLAQDKLQSQADAQQSQAHLAALTQNLGNPKTLLQQHAAQNFANPSSGAYSTQPVLNNPASPLATSGIGSVGSNAGTPVQNFAALPSNAGISAIPQQVTQPTLAKDQGIGSIVAQPTVSPNANPMLPQNMYAAAHPGWSPSQTELNWAKTTGTNIQLPASAYDKNGRVFTNQSNPGMPR